MVWLFADGKLEQNGVSREVTPDKTGDELDEGIGESENDSQPVTSKAESDDSECTGPLVSSHMNSDGLHKHISEQIELKEESSSNGAAASSSHQPSENWDEEEEEAEETNNDEEYRRYFSAAMQINAQTGERCMWLFGATLL